MSVLASRLRKTVTQQQSSGTAKQVIRRFFSAEATLNEANFPKPPGPAVLPVVGTLWSPDMMRITNPETMRGLYKKYGPIMHYEAIGRKIVLVSDVHMAREVLRDKAPSFTNGESFSNAFKWFFPNAVLAIDGAQWKRVRKVLQKAIQGTRIEDALSPLSIVVDRADNLLIRELESCDVHKLACNMAFDTFGFWAFDLDFNTMGGENPELLASCEAIAATLTKRTVYQPFEWLWRLPTKENMAADRGLAFLKRYAAELFQSRDAQELAKNDTQKDLLSALVAASHAEDDSKKGMTNEEIIDNICTIFFAAYDTTSATIAFTMHFLAEHIGAQQKLANELQDLDLAAISKDQLDDLKYLDSVCKEANRLRSTAFAFVRTPKVDVQIGGYHIDAGSLVVIDHTSLPAQDPELWNGQTDLTDFRPERWAEKPHKLASLPFGFGSRRCPGSQLATMEHKFITASLVQRYHWRLDKSRPMEVTTHIGLCPKNGCWLIPEKRTTPQA